MYNWFTKFRNNSNALNATNYELKRTRALYEDLRKAHEDLNESYTAVSQAKHQAEALVEKMKIMRDAATVETATLRICQEIEDLFASGQSGGRLRRFRSLQILVIEAVQCAIRGEKDYDFGWYPDVK